MESTFTKKSLKLEHLGSLLFRVSAQTAVPTPAGLQQAPLILSQIQVFAPCTKAQAAAFLRTCLGHYSDDELISQIDAVVEDAFRMIPDVVPGSMPTPSTPAPPPVTPLN